MYKFLIILITSLVFGCVPIENKEILWERTDTYEITGISPPNQVYVMLRRVSDGSVYTNVYVSKYCKKYDKISVGQRINLSYMRYKCGGGYKEDFNKKQLRDCLCK